MPLLSRSKMRLDARVGAACLLIGPLLGLGCGNDQNGPGGGVAARLILQTQPSAAAESGIQFTRQPVIQLVDAGGDAVAQRGVLVTPSVASGAGALSGGSGVRTDDQGRATFTDLVLSGLVGARTLRFQATGLSPATSESIDLSAGAPANMVPSAGNNLTGIAGRDLPVSPGVRITDAAGNPVAGVAVEFAVTGGGGSITGASQTTGADGVAAVTSWTLGLQPGINTLTATSPSLDVSVMHSATGVLGAHVEIVDGNNQMGFAGDTLVRQVVVTVLDDVGQRQAGVTVTFEAEGGGSFDPTSVTTDAGGLARSSWILGPQAGPQQARASAPDVADGIVSATAEVFQQISPGWRHSCALTPVGKAYCWGANDFNQLGLGTAPSSPRRNPLPLSGGLTFLSLQAAGGGNFSCGIVSDSTGYCWGSNGHGQRGDGTPSQGIGNSTRFPTQLAGGLLWRQITVGGDHACGVTVDDVAYCWGANTGELGDGTTIDRTVPTPVFGGLLFKSLAAGRSHTCGITTTDQIYCWGRGISFGGSQPQVLVPMHISTAVVFASLSGGWISTCGLSTAGLAYCWGSNGSGQVGDGSFAARATPTAVAGGVTWTTIDMRGQTGCGVTTAGQSACWGENGGGESGNGTQINSNVPVAIAGPTFSTFTTIQSGGEVGCGLVGVPGRPLCWGPNNFSQVGDGTSVMRLVPTPVRFP
jgi:hypothetical protein